MVKLKASLTEPVLVLSAVLLTVATPIDVVLAQQSGTDRITLLEGEQQSATIVAIDADGRLQGSGLPEKIDLDGLRRIERPVNIDQVTSASVLVELRGGGRIPARGVTGDQEHFQVNWNQPAPIKLSIDSVSAIRFQISRKVPSSFEQALAKPSPDEDQLFVITEEKIEVIRGLVEGITDQRVVLDRDGQQYALPHSKVYGIVLAQAEAAALPRLMVSFAGGARLPAETIQVKQGECSLRMTDQTQITLPWKLVHRIDIRSRRMTFLSDLDPVQAQQQPIVTLPVPWRRDKSVGGRPLTLGERQYEKGLGVHAESRLTYDLGDGYDAFAATIGIDKETGGRGDCLFRVLGDGKTLYEQRVQGGDPPRTIHIKIDGLQRLTLLVEPGQDLDLADHADWCDARLIRQPR